MPQYVVISDGIFTSTLSDLPPFARIAWLLILFEAEKLKGRVYMPLRTLAHRASISIEEATEAIQMFLDPDPNSGSKDHDGRRLLPVADEPNWYLVTTWQKHAEQREVFFNRLRQQRHQQKKKEEEREAQAERQKNRKKFTAAPFKTE